MASNINKPIKEEYCYVQVGIDTNLAEDGKKLGESKSPQTQKVKYEERIGKDDTEKEDITRKRQKHEGGLGKIVATHYNQLEEKGLKERNLSRIVYMRNFNNWVKSYLIIKYLELIRENSADEHKILALDMGCGKGGDLMKWQKGNIRHLICADIAGTSISQCKERYETFKHKGRIFSAEFIVADCAKTRLKNHIKFPESKLDLVSCQFAFHYSFESLSQAETMIQNVSDLLRKGGYFFATIADANKIVSSLKASKNNSFGNEVFKIQFPEDRPENPPVFGDTYNFFLEGVVDCPEFLVHFPTLIRLCEKYGLELVYKKSFEDLFEEGFQHRDCKNLLFKMRALELYPSMHGNPLASQNAEEYSHAEDYMGVKNVSCVKTISKSEWEAICLYLGFAFKKIV